MKLCMIASMLVAALFLDTAAMAQTRSAAAKVSASYEITGTVLNSLDGNPVQHCYLTWEPVERRSNRESRFSLSVSGVETDSAGRFSFTVPSAGWWRLRAAARGYATQLFEQHGDFYAAVVVGSEIPRADIKFLLSPESAISGTVLDESGDAVRNAQITLEQLSSPVPGMSLSPAVQRQAALTDDRGFYELAGLAPGDYRLLIHAKPWYATEGDRVQNSDQSERLLDVVYPAQWFPGVTDPGLAETIEISASENRVADFHLTPLPDENTHVARAVPTGSIRSGRTSSAQAVSNGTQSVDVADGALNMVHLTIHFLSNAGGDDPDSSSGTSVRLIGADGQQISYAPDSGPTFRRPQSNHSPETRTVEISPGRYEIAIDSRPGIYLSGLSATGAQIVGRFLTADAGDVVLSVHTATTRAAIDGIVKLQGKPIVGAMVLLVPISIEDQVNLIPLREEISNSDGSFELLGVVPAKYILLVIQNGWQINWKDKSTLLNYLSVGTALEIGPSSQVRLVITPLQP